MKKAYKKPVAVLKEKREYSSKKKVKVIKDLIVREIAGEYILIPTGDAALKIHGIINLSESGCLLFNKMQSECTEAELLETILNEYDIDCETALQDIRSFIEKMEKIGILENNEEGKDS